MAVSQRLVSRARDASREALGICFVAHLLHTPSQAYNERKAALSDTPVVLVNYARRVGKSTLVNWFSSKEYPAKYLILDDSGVLAPSLDGLAGFLKLTPVGASLRKVMTLERYTEETVRIIVVRRNL